MLKRIIFSFVASLSLMAADFIESDIRSAFLKQNVVPLSSLKLHSDVSNASLVHLGKNLFFDKVLSGNKDISCATCHFPTKGSADHLPVSIGTGGFGLGEKRSMGSAHLIPRNAPAAFNMAYDSFHTTMWDERISVWYQGGKMVLQTPEPSINGPKPLSKHITKHINSVAAAQALFPVTSFHEMRGAIGENEIADAKNNLQVWERLLKRILDISEYRRLLKESYPEIKSIKDFTYGHIARAIAAFEMHSFHSESNDFDRFLKGKNNALTRSQMRGASLFVNKGQCIACHKGPHLTDFKSYSSGMPQLGPGKEAIKGGTIGEDFGLYLITKNPKDLYKFKTPTLRNVEITGPWSHSGAYNNLNDFLYHHVNAKSGMENFLSSPESYVSPSFFVSYIDFDKTRNEARVQSTDKRLSSLNLNRREINDLVQFLTSLSDLSHYSRVKIPKSVPSGLSVDP